MSQSSIKSWLDLQAFSDRPEDGESDNEEIAVQEQNKKKEYGDRGGFRAGCRNLQ